MTDSLGDLLAGKRRIEPPEIRAAKTYIQEVYKASCNVALRKDQLVITVASAALAGTLRLHTLELQAAVKTDLRIVIRIGS